MVIDDKTNTPVTTNSDLIQSIGRVEFQILGLGTEMKELREDFRTEVRDMRSCIRDIVEGNGSRPGLIERIVVAEKRLDALDAERSSRSMPRAVWLPLIVGLLVSLGSLAVALAGLGHH